ncbi:MAG: glycosyltransferase family 2 protein [Chloroflexota bacterium]|nr:glycosyltransferase family 2 protein [Chloroflexota bacterium]
MTTPEPAPKVSVIIPTYNRAALLPRAVDSVLAQPCQDFELLIVDDCSADDTPQVIAAFTDPRIRAFRHDANRHISASLNTGIANARGEYITFLEDDNELTPNSITCRLEALESASPDVALAYGWLDFVDDSTGAAIEKDNYRFTLEGKEARQASLRFQDFTGIGGILARTAVVQKIGGFDERIRMGMDVFFMCSMQMRYSVTPVRQVVGIIHKKHGHLKATHWSNFDNVIADLAVFRRHFEHPINDIPDLDGELARMAPRFLRIMATRAARDGELAEMLFISFKLLKTYPLSLGNLRLPLHLLKGYVFYFSPLRRYRLGLQRLLGQR